jgi:DNA primase
MAEIRKLSALVRQEASLADVVLECASGKFPGLTADSAAGKFVGNHGTHTGGDGACVLDLNTQRWVCHKCRQEGNEIWQGDVIAWVQSTQFDGDRTRYRDAIDWLCDYYHIEKTMNPADKAEYDVFESLSELTEFWHERLIALPERLDWIEEKWGLTKQTVSELKLGFCDEIPKGMEQGTLINAGVVDFHYNQPLANRIIWPYFQYGQVVYMSGRLPYDTADKTTPKYTNLYKTDYVRPTLYNFDNAYGYDRKHRDETLAGVAKTKWPLIFTEGLPDAAAAHQFGLRAVAPGGASSFSAAMQADTKVLLDRCDDCFKYIVFDSDKAGQRGSRALAQNLAVLGTDAIIADLPSKEGEKLDLADYLRTTTPEELFNYFLQFSNPTTGEQNTLAASLIREMSATSETRQFKEVMEVLTFLPHSKQERYLSLLADKTKSNKSALKKEMVEVQKKAKTTKLRIIEDYERNPFYAQDFSYDEVTKVWRAYRCLHVPFEETITQGVEETTYTVRKPVLITMAMYKDGNFAIEKTEVMNLDTMTDDQKTRIPHERITTKESNRWSMKRQHVYSYQQFQEKGGRIEIDPGRLYDDILAELKRYVWMPDEQEFVPLALYIMYTYIYMGFSSCPYIHLRGQPGTGKSTTGRIIDYLGFYSIPSGSTTEAALFRSAHAGRGLFVFEEAEKLNNPQDGTTAAAIVALCNVGYTNDDSAYAIRCNTNDYGEQDYFFVYGPKVFVSTKGLKNTLSERSIVFEFSKGNEKNINLNYRDFLDDLDTRQGELQEIRDRLHVWSLTRFRAVREVFDELRDSFFCEGMTPRTKQIWMPLFALARYVGEAKGTDLLTPLIDLSMKKMKRAQIVANQSDFAVTVLTALYELYKDNPETAGVHTVDDVEYLNGSKASTQIQLYLNKEQEWKEGFNRLQATFIVEGLRKAGAIDKMAKPERRMIGGERVRVYRFDGEALGTYITTINAGLEEGEGDA